MRHSLCLILLCFMLPSEPAIAQSGPIAPPNLGRYVAKPSLSAADLKVIEAFVNREAPRLRSKTQAEAVQARTTLIDDITSSHRVSPVFREQYTNLLAPHLRSTLEGDDTPAAILAAQVTATLGTDGAVKLLTDRIEIADEPRNAVRLWAAGGLAPLAAAPTVSERRLMRALRTVALGMGDEPNWAVRRRTFMALAAAVSNERGKDAAQGSIRRAAMELMAKAMDASFEDIGKGQVDHILALPVATGALQNTLLIANSPTEREEQAKAMVPSLAAGHASILQSWDQIRANPRTMDAAARYLDESELLLYILTDTQQTGPQLSEALRGGDRATMQAAADRWKPHRR